MARYVELDALVAEINRQQRKLCLLGQSKEVELRKSAAIQNGVYCSFLSFLNTLEVKEVDIEKELESWRHNHFHGRRDKEASGEYLERVSQLDLAKHFFELGLNAQRKNVSIQNVDDVLKELGVDPYSKEAKRLKDSYYAALNKLLAQKGE